MSGQAAAVSVPGLLALLEACGAHVAPGEGEGLALTGKRPPAPLLEALRARKPDILAYLRGQEAAGQAADGKGGRVLPVPSLPDKGAHNPRTLSTRPDWDAEAAKAGRCGSCTRAEAAPDWGPLMVRCTCDPAAWWPLAAPLALHVGARCGAYLTPGEEVGRGYRSREAAKTWGTGRPAAPVARPAHRGDRA